MKKLILAAAMIAATPAAAETIAIVNGKVATVASTDVIEGGTVVIRDGRIAAVGANVAVPQDARVVDAAGGWVTPGIFAGFSRLGIVEVDAVSGTNDITANKANYSAAIDVAAGLNPRTTAIAVTRIEGVTRAAVMPDASADIFGGQGLVMSLADGTPIMKQRAFQYIQMGEGGARIAGGSRGALFVRLADAFAEAAAYARSPAGYQFGRDKGSLLTKADAAALARVISGETAAVVEVDRASDILAVLSLKRDYPKMRMILAGAAEGWTVADQIAAAGVPVLASVTPNLPETFEALAATQSNAGRMIRAGVKVALVPIDRDFTHQVRLIPQQAGNLVAQGAIPGGAKVSHAEALAAITRTPAEIFGFGAELGTLEPGKRADVVVWSGDPIDLAAAPTSVFIDGKPVSLVSRQTELRDRYNPLRQDSLPKQYVR